METAGVQVEIFVLAAIGFLLGKRGMLSASTREQLVDILFAVFLPASVIDSFMIEMTPEVIEQTVTVLALACGIQVFYALWNKVFYRGAQAEHKVVLRYATMVSNAALIGMPVAVAYFGPRGMLLSSVFLIPQRVLTWSYGLTMFGGERGHGVLRKLATHPCIVSIEIGFVVMGLYTAGFELPEPVRLSISALSGCSTPVSMVIVGGILSDCHLRDAINREVLSFSFYRLILIPLCVAAILFALPIDPVSAQVAVLLTGMPAATLTVMLASKYRRDAPFASEVVMSTTLFSLVTIPAMGAGLSFIW